MYAEIGAILLFLYRMNMLQHVEHRSKLSYKSWGVKVHYKK